MRVEISFFQQAGQKINKIRDVTEKKKTSAIRKCN